MATEDMVILVARRWVRLPGTDCEVYLQGKSGELHIRRNGGPFDGWSLPSCVYVRRVKQPERE